MKRYLLHSPFNIYHFEATIWTHAVHNHTYFEIIFVLQGNGRHNINGNTFDYSNGDVFLLGPEDYHSFEINAPTEFCFIRFNDSVLKEQMADKINLWQQVLNAVLFTSSQSRGAVVSDKQDKVQLFSLLAILEVEYENKESKYFDIIRTAIMQSMMTILARNLSVQSAQSVVLKDSVEAILVYVKQHIYEPSKLSIEHLADVFNYSPDYVSIFFKRHTGESLKQYITKYKMKLIEIRLLYSQMTVGEIADEFGFIDESHFCKQFKKFTGSTPTAFRKVS